MKKSHEIYLPLHWVDFAKKNMVSLYKYSDIIQKICSPAISRTDRNRLIVSIPEIANCFSCVSSLNASDYSEFMNDLNAMSIIGVWTKNKQVYKFDSDFLNELTTTESIVFTKDCFDYLPYQTFYIDISDNTDLCERVITKGLFLKVDKLSSETSDEYLVRICRVTDSIFFYDSFTFKNEDTETYVTDVASQTEISIYTNEILGIKNTFRFDGRLYVILLQQVLTYLASTEPDLVENVNTKRTYRKPTENSIPKDKFSEIRQWDVGVRFGSSFRRWKQQSVNRNNTSRGVGERARQRPHLRRAHWSHYWYGHGNEKVRRPKWVASYMVNIDSNTDSPTTIHRVDEH